MFSYTMPSDRFYAVISVCVWHSEGRKVCLISTINFDFRSKTRGTISEVIIGDLRVLGRSGVLDGGPHVAGRF